MNILPIFDSEISSGYISRYIVNPRLIYIQADIVMFTPEASIKIFNPVSQDGCIRPKPLFDNSIPDSECRSALRVLDRSHLWQSHGTLDFSVDAPACAHYAWLPFPADGGYEKSRLQCLQPMPAANFARYCWLVPGRCDLTASVSSLRLLTVTAGGVDSLSLSAFPLWREPRFGLYTEEIGCNCGSSLHVTMSPSDS
jgi:hypothetical protein